MSKNLKDLMKKLLRKYKKLNSFTSYLTGLLQIKNILNLLKEENALLRSRIDLLNNQINGLYYSQFIFTKNNSVKESFSEKKAIPVMLPSSNYPSYEEGMLALKEKYSKAFPIWEKLRKNAMPIYLADPVSSLSIEGNIAAQRFSDFVSLFIRGRVLDIGCGLAEMPVYLKNYPNWAIAGIDPEESNEERKFLFIRAVGELLPWPEDSFETVIIATSLDHALSLHDTLSEVRRVLVNDGRLLVWVGFIPGSKIYNPFDENLEEVDQYHLFHFDKTWFEELFANYFLCMAKVCLIEGSFFYCFGKNIG